MSMLQGLPAPNTTTTSTAAAAIPQESNGYIPVPVSVDPNQLTADAFGFIAEQIPGWQPYEGQLEAWVIEALAQEVAAYAQTAAAVPVSIFMFLGSLLGIAPVAGAPAQAPTTWTMVDAQGYTVPSGTVVAFQNNGNTYTLFQTTAAFSVPTGQTSTSPGAVTIEAVEAGSGGNAIAAATLTLADSLAYVASVVSTEPTSGGTDAETVPAYISRFANRLQLVLSRPVFAADFATLSVGQQGCARALGIDNFDALSNMLTPPDDAFGTGVGSWAGITNCSVAQSSAQVETGSFSLAVTSGASGAFLAATNGQMYPVSPGNTYAAVLGARAASTTETVSAVIRWRNSTGSVISTSTGTGATDSTTAWTSYQVLGTAPAGAVTAEVGISASAAAASEVHYVGEAALFFVPSGATVPAWSAGGAMSGVERAVTVVPLDDFGDALSPSAMASVDSYLQGLREINFLVRVAPPTYCPLAIVAVVACNYGANINSVQAAVQGALTSYLSAANWASAAGTPPVWLNDPTVRYLALANTVLATAGVHHIVSLSLNGGTADVTMPGYAPLPSASVSVTVTTAPAGT